MATTRTLSQKFQAEKGIPTMMLNTCTQRDETPPGVIECYHRHLFSSKNRCVTHPVVAVSTCGHSKYQLDMDGVAVIPKEVSGGSYDCISSSHHVN